MAARGGERGPELGPAGIGEPVAPAIGKALVPGIQAGDIAIGGEPGQSRVNRAEAGIVEMAEYLLQGSLDLIARGLAEVEHTQTQRSRVHPIAPWPINIYRFNIS